MIKFAPLLIATAVISATSVARADLAPGQAEREEFRWIEVQNGDAPEPETDHPLLDGYPVGSAPANGLPAAGEPRFTDRAGQPISQGKGASTSTQECDEGDAFCRGPGAPDQRRGYENGEDGRLEAVQTRPTPLIRREGGETPGSRMGYSHPDDVRRATMLEDRIIPTHEIGSVRSNASPLWHVDPSNPYADPGKDWTVHSGEMLSGLLERWGSVAGYTIVWRSAHDYVLRADVILKGSFPEAAGEVIESFANASPPIAAEFYPRNKVLVVKTSSDIDGR
jgi:hypothetical protein